MAHRSGLDGFLGIGTESAYGTRVVPTTFLPINSESLSLTQEFVSTNPLMSGIMVQPDGLHRASTRTAEGSIEMELYDRGMGKLLNMLHGNVVAVTTPGGGTLARQQVHSIGKTSPVGKGLSVQVGRPDTSGTVQPFDYSGCKITEAVITVEKDAAATVSFTIDAQDEVTSQSLATPTYVTAARPFTFQDCTLKLGGSAAANVRSATITIPLGMATDRYLLGNGGKKDQPLLNDFSVITFGASLEFASLADHTRFRAGTSVSLELLAAGGIIEAATPYSMSIKAAAARQVSSSPVLAGPDVLTADVDFEVKWDGANDPLVITTISTDSAL